MTLDTFRETLNKWCREKVPFFFCVDFELEKPFAFKTEDIDTNEILFKVNDSTNVPHASSNDLSKKEQKQLEQIKLTPISFDAYSSKFDKVVHHLNYGDSFLTNLTVKTKIETTQSLKELFQLSHAKYKLWLKDQLLVFSPETFVQIREGKIFSYPMKGTIDATIENAADIILNDVKEQAEHITIVDLIRNDLSLVSTHVHVSRFRYIDEIRTNTKNLLQISSEVIGTLPADYHDYLGDILITLLPAGSISGAPKQKTLEIIAGAEGEKRGYYTGVFGYFDGHTLDSAVMIRFIEQSGSDLFYRSGGGITTQSVPENEYQEVIDKVYVPVN